MTDLTIPDEAVKAVYASPYADSLTNKGIRSTLELGAPLILAAELRRMVQERMVLLRKEREVCNVPPDRCTFCREMQEKYDSFAMPLLLRARELDPNGAQQ